MSGQLEDFVKFLIKRNILDPNDTLQKYLVLYDSFDEVPQEAGYDS